MEDFQSNHLEAGLSGRDNFAGIFSAGVTREAEWLRRTSGQKVAAIRRLLRSAGLAPRAILEIGAGTGAVIGALRAQGVGQDHFAADFSDEALGVLRATDPGVKTAVAIDDETFGFAYGQAGLKERIVRRATSSVLPRLLGPLWTCTYHAHCAAHCVRA